MSDEALFLPLRECSVSDWYTCPEDHRCPHDSWVESISISEPSSGEHHEQRELQIRIRLLAAYHDAIIELTYAGVRDYSLQKLSDVAAHGDWLEDKVENLGKSLVHTITFANGSFRIEASDAEYRWIPLPNFPAPR